MKRRSGKDRLPDRERPVGRAVSRPQRSPAEPERSPTPGVVTSEAMANYRAAIRGEGGRLIVASWAGTALLTLVVVAGLVALDQVAPVVVGVSGAMFVAGSVAFFVAYATAVNRSRHEVIGVGGLYFMAGSAPHPVRRLMMGSLAVELIVMIIAVAARPFSSLVFTSLAPVYALGLAGWWNAKFGTFAPRPRD